MSLSVWCVKYSIAVCCFAGRPYCTSLPCVTHWCIVGISALGPQGRLGCGKWTRRLRELDVRVRPVHGQGSGEEAHSGANDSVVGTINARAILDSFTILVWGVGRSLIIAHNCALGREHRNLGRAWCWLLLCSAELLRYKRGADIYIYIYILSIYFWWYSYCTTTPRSPAGKYAEDQTFEIIAWSRVASRQTQ